MLNFEQFTALVKAGCNEEQIKVINNLFSTEPPAEPPANPNQNPNPNPNPPADNPGESETVKMLKEMLGLMQKGAINNMQITQPKTQTSEQILASVLEP